MHRWKLTLPLLFLTLALSAATAEEPASLQGFSRNATQVEREWEGKFRSIPSPDNLREYMKRLAARPHHVGSPYDKENAEWTSPSFKGGAGMRTSKISTCFSRRPRSGWSR